MEDCVYCCCGSHVDTGARLIGDRPYRYVSNPPRPFRYALTILMLVLSQVHIYALPRRGQSRGRVSQPVTTHEGAVPRHSESKVVGALLGRTTAFLWQAVRGRLAPGRFSFVCRFATPVRSATQSCRNGGWQLLNYTKEIRKMACPPFKLARRLSDLIQAENHLGGFRDV